MTDAIVFEDSQSMEVSVPVDQRMSDVLQESSEPPDDDFEFFRGLLIALALSALIYSLLYFLLL
jgi:hypothetical protein